MTRRSNAISGYGKAFSSLIFWVDYFGELARDGDFDGDMLEDQISIYAVFEDLLRRELFDFVEAWNLHRIRLQKNRPHVVHGQPWMNYHYPDPDKACNWGIPIDRSILDEMERPLADIDISTSLEPETKNWCRQVLLEMGYDHRQLEALLNIKHYLSKQTKPEKVNLEMGNQQSSHLLSLGLRTSREATWRKYR
ncbi:hypothetical protein HRG_013533 [Hirsutella rhossiliensis]